ncbi:MAG: glycoside hydrolase family 88 protein [Clostridiales bacterium]|nr:glycoside hydrolase family 88 protein [Clostridiales bacterium]
MDLSDSAERWQDAAFRRLERKMERQLERVGSSIPYAPIKGRYIDCMMPGGLSWWTNGFWSGMLWQMHMATKEERYKETAQKVDERLGGALSQFEGLNHDIGFMFSPSAVTNWRVTGNTDSRRQALHAANLLAGRFNPTGNFIRAWDESMWGDTTGWMIIDCLLNLPLLYWATDETGDPRFADIATRHANTALSFISRGDGSCCHIASFAPKSGEFLGSVEGQGFSKDSSWSRGQAWAVYGFALACRHTEDTAFLDKAKNCAHYCIANLAISDWLPFVDFRAPKEPVKHDSGAGAILACGFLEIAERVPDLEKRMYLDAAYKTLQAIEKKFANWDPETDGILRGATTMYHNDRMPSDSFIYGDYFFMEAILRLCDKNYMIW